MPARRDLGGMTFGRLTARKRTRVGDRAGWLCDCECGTVGHPVSTANLTRKGAQPSCGCRRAEVSGSAVPLAGGTCEYCGTAFLGAGPVAGGARRYCTEKCGADAARAAALGPVPSAKCGECGTEFVPRQRKKRAYYCSRACKDRAMDRKKGERRASQTLARIGTELEKRNDE